MNTPTTSTSPDPVVPQINTYNLHELGYKIFLDRYAQKDIQRVTLKKGDVVIAIINNRGQREIGVISDQFNHIDDEGRKVTEVEVTLLNGDIHRLPIEHIDKPIELDPAQMMKRVARGIADMEQTDEAKAEWREKFEWLLSDWRFVPGGRILTAAGTDQKLSYFNCFVIGSIKDSREGIFAMLAKMAEIMSRGGGVGLNISSLRPRHAYVKGVNGRSSGAVSWGALFSFVTGLIQQAGCFAGDTRISTDKGLIKAKELVERIENGETFYAYTHKGLRPIVDKFRNGVKPVYEVITKRGYKLKITADHKVAVLMDGKITTMQLRYLQPGDEILLVTGNGANTNYIQLNTVPFTQSGQNNQYTDRRIHRPELLDEDLAYLLGYSFGNANTYTDKTLRISVPNQYPKIMERLIQIAKNKFGIDAVIQNGEGAFKTIALYSRELIAWMKTNGFEKPKAKAIRVPEAIFKSPFSVSAAFISGYFDADGSNRAKGGFRFDSISRDMLEDIQVILASGGIISRISTQIRTNGWSDTHCLTITGKTYKERFINKIAPMKIRNGAGKRDMYHTYPYSVVAGIRNKHYKDVYDGESSRVSTTQIASIAKNITNNDSDRSTTLMESLNTCPDTIVSITELAPEETYDFEVADVHLLSGNGVYTSNSRRGALILILNDWHPDIFEFIESKRTAGQITNANISVGISDRLMEAIKNDEDWDLVFPDTSHPAYNTEWNGILEQWIDKGYPVIKHRTVKAREIWNAITESAWASAEPGMWFRERSNKMSNSWYYPEGYLSCTNPCGEIPLPNQGVCNLGSLNLPKFLDENGEINWDYLKVAVQYAVRFLDNAIDANYYFMDDIAEQQLSERRVGLGIMGLGELLVRLGIRYGSDESVALIDKLFRFIATTAYLTSSNIAAEKGSFPKFNAELYLQSGFMMNMPDEVRKTVAKQGIRNVTLLTIPPTGSTGTLVNTSTGIEPYFSWSYYRKGRLGVHEERVPIYHEWREKHGEDAPLPDYFVTAMELSPEEHVKVQAAAQRWIDSAISKTTNAPNNYTVEQTRKLYEYLYDMGCKGGTIYRDGSRDEQVLILKNESQDENSGDTVSSVAPEYCPNPKDCRASKDGNGDLVCNCQPRETETVVIHGADQCPECESIALIHEEGCTKCAICGWSKCEIRFTPIPESEDVSRMVNTLSEILISTK